MTLQEVLNIIPDDKVVFVYTEYGKVDKYDWLSVDYKNRKVIEITPALVVNCEPTISIYIEMPKVMPCELSGMALIRALYEYIYYIREEYVDFEPNADIAEIYADMHAFWGNSDYTIDNTGRWYDADGERIF